VFLQEKVLNLWKKSTISQVVRTKRTPGRLLPIGTTKRGRKGEPSSAGTRPHCGEDLRGGRTGKNPSLNKGSVRVSRGKGTPRKRTARATFGRGLGNVKKKQKPREYVSSRSLDLLKRYGTWEAAGLHF